MNNVAQLLREFGTGVGETALSLGSGMASQIPAGIGGVVEYIRSKGDGKLAADKVNELLERYTYEPRSDAGRRGIENIGKAVESVVEPVKGATIDPIGDRFPMLGAALLAGTELIGPKGAKPRPRVKLGATPHSEALRTAQINAAKPVSEGGLGLKKNNTPMERAKAMGYDTERPLYHGSLSDIKEIDLDKSTGEGHAGRGFYMTPSAEDASINYASPFGPDTKGKIISQLEQRGYDPHDKAHGIDRTLTKFNDDDLSPARLEKVVRGTGVGENLGTVYPLLVKHGKEANLVDPKRSGYVDAGEIYNEKLDDYEPGPDADKWSKAYNTLKHYDAQPPSSFTDATLEGGRLDTLVRAMRKEIPTTYDPDTGTPLGAHGLATEVLRDLGANTFTHPTNEFRFPLNIAGSHTIALQPEGIVRSRFAAFDPARAGSRDILGFSKLPTLGAAAALAAGGAALSKYLRGTGEEKKEEKKVNPPPPQHPRDALIDKKLREMEGSE